MKILLQAIKSLLRKVENTAERVLNFFGGDGIIKQEHLPEGYPGTTIGVILPSTTIEIDSGESVGFMFNPITLVAGNEYIVTLNGAEYGCVAQSYEMGNSMIGGSPARGVLIGAAEVLGIGEGDYPFSILVLDQPGEIDGRTIYAWVYVSVDMTGTPVTISVTENKIVKMDARYLPDPILSSPNGTRYKITVDDNGTLSAIAITE